MMLELFPNAKEVTESFGCFRAIHQYLHGKYVDLQDPDVVCVVVGDGTTPRTAATIAFRSKWWTYSIDPILKTDKRYHINKLTMIQGKIQDQELDFPGKKVVIILPHAHVTVPDCLRHIKGAERYVIALPCCTDPNMDRAPNQTYLDFGIFSPQNRIMIWKKV
jgi:hypothetical protein